MKSAHPTAINDRPPSTCSQWVEASLGEILPLKYGKSRSNEHGYAREQTATFGSNGAFGTFDRALTTGPTIVIGRKGAAGAVHYSSNPCWPIDTAFYTEGSDHLYLPFFCYLLSSLQLVRLDKSTAIPSLSRDDYDSKVVRFPLSSNEQQRIVKKIEELFSDLDKGIENLKLARAQLAVYRQALLKHAFEGKLTADWRAAYAGQLESGEQVLAGIEIERNARYQKLLDDWQAAAKAWGAGDQMEPKPSKPRKLPDVPAITDAELAGLPELPVGWTWTKLGASDCDVFDGPFGSNLKTSDYVGAGVRVVRLENIGVMRFVEEKESFISEEKYRDLTEHTVFPGDIVFSSFVTEQTRVALVPKSVTKAVNKSDCFCVRLHGPSLLNRYACVFLSTRFTYKQLEAVIHGVGRPRVNTSQLKDLCVPVCSPAEQIELMKRIDAQFSALDEMEKTAESEIQKSEALRQSILKKAFAGELVPQDPNDEPAAALLARIRAERTAQSAAPKPKKARAAKA